jgi:hypothetical protein
MGGAGPHFAAPTLSITWAGDCATAAGARKDAQVRAAARLPNTVAVSRDVFMSISFSMADGHRRRGEI